MDESEIIVKLDQLAECRSAREILEADKAQRLKDAIPPEVQAEFDAIMEEFDAPLSASAELTGTLEGEIRDAVGELEHSVKGNLLHAVWSKGRVTWISDALEGYAMAHPEILNFQKIGSPSVSIREIK